MEVVAPQAIHGRHHLRLNGFGSVTNERDRLAIADFEASLAATSLPAIRLARSLGISAEDAADVVQQAALQAWRYRDTRRGEFKPWFMTIVCRVAKRNRPWVTLPVFWQHTSAWPSEAGGEVDLASALKKLSRNQRAALWLRYGEDLTISDVAMVLGVRETAAKQLLFRARTALRNELKSLGWEISNDAAS